MLFLTAMSRIIYTGKMTRYHEWALPYLEGYDVEFISGREDYKEEIRKADICVSIVPDHRSHYLIIPAKLYDYIEQRKKILHFAPGPGLSTGIRFLMLRDGIILKGDPQERVDNFILHGYTDYTHYKNQYGLERQYRILKNVIDGL